MALSFSAGPANTDWNSSASSTTFAVGNSLTQFVSGNLYIAEVSGNSIPSSLSSTLDIAWSLVSSASTAIGGHAVWVGIATASSFNSVTTVTFPSASLGAFGGITTVSGITNDGANGTLLVSRVLTQYVSGVTHSFDFGSVPSTNGYWIGAMMHQTVAGTGETFSGNTAGWTATTQAFRSGIPTFTTPYFNSQSITKVNPTQPIGGSWVTAIGGELSYAVALEIKPSASGSRTKAYQVDFEIADPAPAESASGGTKSHWERINWSLK